MYPVYLNEYIWENLVNTYCEHSRHSLYLYIPTGDVIIMETWHLIRRACPCSNKHTTPAKQRTNSYHMSEMIHIRRLPGKRVISKRYSGQFGHHTCPSCNFPKLKVSLLYMYVPFRLYVPTKRLYY